MNSATVAESIFRVEIPSLISLKKIQMRNSNPKLAKMSSIVSAVPYQSGGFDFTHFLRDFTIIYDVLSLENTI